MKKNFVGMLLLCLCLRLWSWGEQGGAPRVDSGAVGSRIVTAELGWRYERAEGAEAAAPGEDMPCLPAETATPASPAETPAPPEPSPAPDEPAPTPLPTESPAEAAEETLSPAPTPRALSFSKDTVTNRTAQTLDLEALRREGLSQRLPAGEAQILILHTHGTEAYTMDPGHTYAESDAYRSTDTACNVVRVGDELAAALIEQGLRVIHDRTLYDYPSYTASYARSAAAVEQWLRLYPRIAVVIDVHRDALGEGETVYKTRWETDGESAAQVMILIGTGENGLAHPLWRENFKLALRLQDAMNAACPGLARPIDLVRERYNQHYTTGSMILEVGSSGNTLPEALRAVRSFGESAAPVLLGLREG